MKTRTVGFLCAVSLLTTLTVFAENVSGTWKGSYPGRDGQTRESTIVLKADGEKWGPIVKAIGFTAESCGPHDARRRIDPATGP